MSYQIIIKRIKNFDYAYLYRSFWCGAEKRSKKQFLKYLGKIDRVDVQRIIADVKHHHYEFFKRKKRRRAPEIDPEDIHTLSPHEKVFINTAIVVFERTKPAYLDNILELLRKYCSRAGIKQPAAWDQTIEYFKTLGWIEVRAGKVKLLLPKRKLREIKREIAGLLSEPSL